MEKRQLSIDEIASIHNRNWSQEDQKYREEHPNEEHDPEPSDEESDITIVIYQKKNRYQDSDGHIYEIADDLQLGKRVSRSS